jgi:hypothetical protein
MANNLPLPLLARAEEYAERLCARASGAGINPDDVECFRDVLAEACCDNLLLKELGAKDFSDIPFRVMPWVAMVVDVACDMWEEGKDE